MNLNEVSTKLNIPRKNIKRWVENGFKKNRGGGRKT